jgi:ankyrin repeat protein
MDSEQFVDADGRPLELHQAAFVGDEKELSIVLKTTDANKLDITKSTALHIAAQQGHLKCVKALIRANADVNVKDGEGKNYEN